MTNILLTGAISLSNKGTCAIVISTIDAIKKRIPDAKIDIELFYPEKQREIYPLDLRHNVNIVQPPIQKPLYGLIIFVYCLMISKIVTFFPSVTYLAPKHYIKADIIIDISAEAFIKYYDDDFIQYTKRYLLHLYPLLLSIFLGKRIVLFAQTLAPFGYFKPLMKYIIKKCEYISVRDMTSIDKLRNEEVDVSNIYYSADPAFLLKPSSKERLDKILAIEGLDIDKIKNDGFLILGVCLARTTGRVLNNKEFNNMINIISCTLNLLMANHKLFIIFIPHSSGKINKHSNDVLVGYELKKNIVYRDHFFTIRGDYSPQDIKSLICKCNILLSLRMHPVIAALSLGIPSVLIAFNDKAYGIMRRFDLEMYVCDIRKLSEYELGIKLTELIYAYCKIGKSISTKMPDIFNKISNDIDNLNNIINGGNYVQMG